MIERLGYLGDLGPRVEDGLLAEAGPPWLRLPVLVTPRVHVHLHGEAGGGPLINPARGSRTSSYLFHKGV